MWSHQYIPAASPTGLPRELQFLPYGAQDIRVHVALATGGKDKITTVYIGRQTLIKGLEELLEKLWDEEHRT